MTEKYRGGVLPAYPGCLDEADEHIEALARGLKAKVTKQMDELHFSDALATVWELIGALNKYIDVTAPWKLKGEEDAKRLDSVLYHLIEGLRLVAILITPVMPSTAVKMFAQLGVPADLQGYEAADFGLLGSVTVKKGEAIFPRIDIKAELEKAAAKQAAAALEGEKKEDKKEAKKEAPAEAKPAEQAKPAYISYDDFMKVELRTARVTDCKPVEGADRLLNFTLDVGGKERTIVSGIRKWYGDDPARLIGKNVVIVANLEPRKIRGIRSEGMILSAATDDDEKLSVITTLDEIESGVTVR